jgi:hypothetical protein
MQGALQTVPCVVLAQLSLQPELSAGAEAVGKPVQCLTEGKTKKGRSTRWIFFQWQAAAAELMA